MPEALYSVPGQDDMSPDPARFAVAGKEFKLRDPDPEAPGDAVAVEEPNYWHDRAFGCLSTNLLFTWFGFIYLTGFQVHNYLGPHTANLLEKDPQPAPGYFGRFLDMHSFGLVSGTIFAVLMQAFANPAGTNCCGVLNRVNLKWRVSTLMMIVSYSTWTVGYAFCEGERKYLARQLMIWSHFVLAFFIAWFQSSCLHLLSGLRSDSGTHWYLIGVSLASLPAILLGYIQCQPVMVYILNGLLIAGSVFTYMLLPCALQKHPDLEKVVYESHLAAQREEEEADPLLNEVCTSSAAEETQVGLFTVVGRNWLWMLSLWFTFVTMFIGMVQIGTQRTTWDIFRIDDVDAQGNPKTSFERWSTVLIAVCLSGDIGARAMSYFLQVENTKGTRMLYLLLAWVFRPLLAGLFIWLLFNKEAREDGEYSGLKLPAYLVLGFSTGFLTNGFFALSMGGARSDAERAKLGPIMGLMLVGGILSGIQLTSRVLIPLAKGEQLCKW